MNKDKALKMALEFLEDLGRNHWGNREAVITAIKEDLAQLEKEPLSYYSMNKDTICYHY